MQDSPPSSTDVESEWNYSSNPHLCRHKTTLPYFRNTRPPMWSTCT